jgi:hypothetical protein
MSCIILRGRWYDIIVLNVLVATEDKIYDMKGSFYEELEDVCDKFPKYHMKVSGDFSVKLCREDVFNTTTGNEKLHDISNDYGVTSSKLCHIQKSYCQKYAVPTS